MVNFESDVLSIANSELTNSEFTNSDIDSYPNSVVSELENPMARTKETERKKEGFVCHVCKKTYKQHFGCKRHLGVQHRVDEANNKISQKEYKRLLSYNSKKKTPTPEATAGSVTTAAGSVNSAGAAELDAAVASISPPPPPAKRVKSIEFAPSDFNDDSDDELEMDSSSVHSVPPPIVAEPPAWPADAAAAVSVAQDLAMSEDEESEYELDIEPEDLEILDRDSDLEILMPPPTTGELVLAPVEKAPLRNLTPPVPKNPTPPASKNPTPPAHKKPTPAEPKSTQADPNTTPAVVDEPWVRKQTRPTKVTGPKRSSSSAATSKVYLNLPQPAEPTPPPAPMDQAASVNPPAPQPSSSRAGSKPKSALQRLQQMTPPLPVRGTIEEVQDAQRRAKAIGSDRLIRNAVDYSHTTKEIADSLASRYNLTPLERRSTLRQLRLIRKSQRQICGEVRQKSKIGSKDGDKSRFLDRLDDKLESVEARHSESDED